MGISRRDVRNAFIGGPGYAYLAHQQHKKNTKDRRRRHASGRQQRSYERKLAETLNKDRADQMKYNKKYYQAEKKANKEQAEFLKKYGGEKFRKYETLNKQQKGLHEAAGRQAEKEIGKRKAPEKISRIEQGRAGRAAKKSILEQLRHPGIKDIEKNKAFSAAQKSALEQLKQPGVTDIRNNPLYQQQGAYLQNLLSESPAAYEAFKAPAMREFNEQIAPQIAAAYGGQRGGSFQRALARAGANLSERLQLHRTNLQQEALRNINPHLLAPQSGEELRNRIITGAQGNLGTFAQLAQHNQQARNEALNEAQQAALGLMQNRQGVEQQDIANLYNYGQQTQNLAGLNLGTPTFGTHYRGPTYQSPIITGGPQPVNRFPGNPPQAAQPRPPSFLQQLAGAALPAAGTAIGAGIGGPIGAAAGGAIGSALNGSFNTPQGGYQQVQAARAPGRGVAFMQENAPTGFQQPWQAPPSRFRGT